MNIILRSVMCFVIIGVSLVSFIGCDSPSDPGNSCFRVEEFQYTHYKRFISTGEPASDGIELSIATGDILFIETETGFKFRAGTEFAWEINATVPVRRVQMFKLVSIINVQALFKLRPMPTQH